jgi:nitrogen fixation NifU-like protein
MPYSPKVIDHYENPRNVGKFDADEKNIGTGLVGAPSCGDVMQLQIKVNPETNVIEDAKFKTFGCLSAIAASSFATTQIIGMTMDDALKLKNSDIAEELSLPPVKIHCSVLAAGAIKKAVQNFKDSQNQEEAN